MPFSKCHSRSLSSGHFERSISKRSFILSSIKNKIVDREAEMLKIEEDFNKTLKEVIDPQENSPDFTSLSNKYQKQLSKVSNCLEKHSYKNPKLLFFVEFYKVPKHLILLIDEFIDCHKATVIEYYGRRQLDIYEAHQGHTLSYCLKMNKMFYETIIIIYYASESNIFNVIFNENDGVSKLLNYIDNQEFITDSFIISEQSSKDNDETIKILKLTMLILLNLTKSIDIYEYRYIVAQLNDLMWEKIGTNLVDKIQAYFRQLFVISFMVLLNTLNNDEKKELKNKNYFTVELLKYLKKAAEDIKAKRASAKTILVHGTYKEVSLILLDGFSIDVVQLLEIAFSCESFEFDRVCLYEDLKLIALHGNNIEAEYAVRGLFQFSFEQRMLKHMATDEKFLNHLKLNSQYEFTNKRLLRYSDSFLWHLKGHKKSYTNAITRQATQTFSFEIIDPYCFVLNNYRNLKDREIFMSFEENDKAMCHKIRDELKRFGIIVWLDDNMTFEKVAEKIKESEVIIPCE